MYKSTLVQIVLLIVNQHLFTVTNVFAIIPRYFNPIITYLLNTFILILLKILKTIYLKKTIYLRTIYY